MIVVCGGIKGGIGKTTVATNLAVMRSLEIGAGKVVLVDSDPQESSYKFTELRNEHSSAGYSCVKLTGKSVRKEVLGLKSKYQDIIIDAGVGDSPGQRAAMLVADVILLPFRPGAYDVWTISTLAQLLDEVREINSTLRALSFINQGDHQGHDNDEALSMLRDCEHIEVLDLQLGYRKAFRNTAMGKAVTEIIPNDTRACSEMFALFRYVFDSFVDVS